MSSSSINSQPQSHQNYTLKEIKSLLFVIFLALVIRIFIMEPFCVPTGSMKATILENDYIFSTKYSYGYSKQSFPFSPNIFSGRILSSSPNRGDIIVFRSPNDMETRLIKRLIGLPGDKIQLINDVIYINDKPIKRQEVGTFIDEDGKEYKKYNETLPNGVSYLSYKLDDLSYYGNTPVFYVPEDKYFFLGDNRDNSRDSRVDLGFVPFENFIAKAQFIWFSTKQTLWNKDMSIEVFIPKFMSWLKSIRGYRIFKNLYRLD